MRRLAADIVSTDTLGMNLVWNTYSISHVLNKRAGTDLCELEEEQPLG